MTDKPHLARKDNAEKRHIESTPISIHISDLTSVNNASILHRNTHTVSPTGFSLLRIDPAPFKQQRFP